MQRQHSEIGTFHCAVEPRRDAVYVRPIGEIDLLTAPLVDEKLIELTDAGFEHVVLDLRRLDFLDSSGLRLILAWHDKARQGRFTFSLIRGQSSVQRLFELTATDQLLNFVAPSNPDTPPLPAVA
jgi:anti-sigma B factor antagonist